MEVATFTCSICGEASREICVFCTKDTCANHVCQRCHRCSDCCACDMPLTIVQEEIAPTGARPVQTTQPEIAPEEAPALSEPEPAAPEELEPAMPEEAGEPAAPELVTPAS